MGGLPAHRLVALLQQGMQRLEPGCQALLEHGNQAMRWQSAHAAGTPVATLIAEGAAAMEQRELALTAGLATDQPRVLG